MIGSLLRGEREKEMYDMLFTAKAPYLETIVVAVVQIGHKHSV